LVEEAGDRKRGNNRGKEDKRREEGHHKVVGQRRRHLQRVILLNVRISADERRLEFTELHSALDAVDEARDF
jgi:hypothetical protein